MAYEERLPDSRTVQLRCGGTMEAKVRADLVTLECPQCSVLFVTSLVRELRATRRVFRCPAGHAQSFTPKAAARGRANP